MAIFQKIATRLGLTACSLAAEIPTLPEHPFGTEPCASRDTYLRLHEEAKAVSYPDVDVCEASLGYAIDRDWMEALALHTQVVVKQSRLNYQHGRLLYAYLRRYCASADGAVTVFETGTARGFSTLCMARALEDAGVVGHVVTVDLLPHNRRFLWNCIDDHDGPKTRQEILAAYPACLRRVAFIEGPSPHSLNGIGLARINFSFLDANHTYDDVMAEYAYVRDRQHAGDVIVFDDVTPGLFDGVVAAVTAIEAEGLYAVERLKPTEQRGYAIAVRK